jgi:hypothetical protein
LRESPEFHFWTQAACFSGVDFIANSTGGMFPRAECGLDRPEHRLPSLASAVSFFWPFSHISPAGLNLLDPILINEGLHVNQVEAGLSGAPIPEVEIRPP